MNVIEISGHARVGKDLAAKFLERDIRDCGYNVQIMHFADLLKYMCKTFCDWDGWKDEAGRTLLQYVGTDVVRAKNPNYWVDFIADALTFFGDRWSYVIIPDARFPNELTRLRERGFKTIHLKITRPDTPTDLTAEQRRHPSETALDDVEPDFYIINDGSIIDLSNKILQWVTEDLNKI